VESPASKEIKMKAVNIVLGRLGTEMDAVIKYHLKRSYAVSVDREDGSDFSLDRIHFGLALLLGQGQANELLRQIAEEIKILSSGQAA
jgi:hypothetical protein